MPENMSDICGFLWVLLCNDFVLHDSGFRNVLLETQHKLLHEVVANKMTKFRAQARATTERLAVLVHT
jgi:hypothetical protein